MTREEAINEIKSWDFLEGKEIEAIHTLIPELAESEDERTRKEIINFLRSPFVNENITDEKVAPWIAWLEKQGVCDIDHPQIYQDNSQPNGCIVLEDFNGGEGFYKLNLDYLNKKQVEEVEKMVRTWNKESKVSNENIKACIGMCLTDANEQRFKDYNTSLKDCLDYLEKQKDLDKMIVVSPEVWDKAIADAYENGKKEGEKQKDLTTENIYKHSRERMSFWNGQQKEQKPAESISQLTVQGKGVYKICPRCKERMVRDDSMVYTSMPPQYRYECPKCGEREFDTVMYDNPEMEEQKPNSTEDMPYITDEHFYEREPADSFKYKLAEYMTRCCTKKEGPYGYEYGISAESILKMAEEELLKRGVVQKPAEWSEEEKDKLNSIEHLIVNANAHGNYLIGDKEAIDLQHFIRSIVKPTTNLAEWSEEDKKMLKRIEAILLTADDDLSDKLNGKVSPITDSAYSSMKICIAKCLSWLKSLPERFNLQPYQEWSEEDEACIRNLESIIYYDKKLPNDTRVILGKFLSNLRPQPKKELSIEKAIQWLDDTFYFLDNSSGRGRDCEITTHDFDSLEEMYNSFRKAVTVDSQPHWKPSEVCYGPKGDPDPAGVWKPSEEQMKALLNAEGFLRAGLQYDSAKTIAGLYEQLKKLM